MSTALDVYRDWLGIKDEARPLNFYQLLRLNKFEDDPVKVRSNYRKMNAHVRKYAAGDFAKQSQDLLNELARAMLCLTDRKRKGEYDASLGRKHSGEERRRTFEELVILRKVVDEGQLRKAQGYADVVGLELRDALVQQKMTTQDVVTQIYAESEGLPYVELDDVGVDEELASLIPAVVARTSSLAPIMVDDRTVLVASPHPIRPDVEDELRLRLGMPIRTVLCTPAAINAAVNKYFPKSAAQAELAAMAVAPAKQQKPEEVKEQADENLEPVATQEEMEEAEIVEASNRKTQYIAAIAGYALGMLTPELLRLASGRKRLTFNLPLLGRGSLETVPHGILLGLLFALVFFFLASIFLKRKSHQ